MLRTAGGWRLLLTGCPSLEEPSSRSTQRWFRHCEVMGAQDGTQHSEMESPWLKHVDGRSVLARNSLEMRGEPSSSSSRLKLAGGGRARPSSSSSWSPTPSLGHLLRRLRGKARVAWFRRWSALLSCAAARAHALSLLERRPVSGLDGVAPHLHEVLGDSKNA